MSKHSLDALVSSRICHDLISPVGAIGNGVELLEGLAKTMPEIALIAESVENAKIKLQFFRVCFGQSSSESVIGTGEVIALATAMLETERLRLRWAVESDGFPRETIKLLFLILLCVETALPVGGQVTVAERGNGFAIHAEGRRVQISDAWDVFSNGGNEVEVTPAQVQFPLAAEVGCDVRMTTTDTSVTVTF